jgi:sodium-independent organic anion transporter
VAQGAVPAEPEEAQVGMVRRLLTDLLFMPRAVTRLLSNPCYLFITLAASVDGLLVTGFSTFMTKYLERQFNMRTSRSVMIIGSIMVPVAGLGTMSSGYIIKRFRLSCPATLKFSIAMVIFALVLSPMFLVYCSHSPLIGVETRYPNEVSAANASARLGYASQLASQCNAGCNCAVSEYNPVCASYRPEPPGERKGEPPEGLSFYSPCYAGCAGGMSPTQRSYANCSCAPDGGPVTRGLCESKCSGLIGFLVLFGPMCFCTFSVGVPVLSVVLRCVDHSERAFALGIQWILIRLIGTIPASSVFGWLFDISCLRRYIDPCSGEDGTCYVYNNKLLADLFLAFALIGQTATLLFLVLALVFYRPKPGQNDPIKAA